MKKVTCIALLAALLLCACAASPSAAQTEQPTESVTASSPTSEGTLPGGTIPSGTLPSIDSEFTCNGSACEAGGITISEAGTYTLKGTLQNGTVIVDALKKDAVTLVLDGAAITSATCAAIYIRQADKVTIMLAENSVNLLANGGSFVQIDDSNIDAVIFSKEDLTISGAGTLSVSSPAGHGVVSKDDLVIAGGVIGVNAASHGFTGKDSLTVSGGSLTIEAGKDALHAENSDDAQMGQLTVSGGTIAITAAGDGISASNTLTIDGGDIAIVSGGGKTVTPADDTSTKGVKAAGTLTVNGGTLAVNACDDALHSNADIVISGGVLTLASGDDGVHADETLSITGGSVTVSDSYEGLEGKIVDISGGDIDLTASDDGINAAGGSDWSGFGGFGGRGMDSFGPDAASDSALRISGGTLTVNAGGDGLDSNGALEVSGGTITVQGPQMSGNGALDYGSTGTITGGTLIAVSAGGMEQNFGADSTQGSILLSVGNQSAGTQVTLTDAGGHVIASLTSAKAFGSVIISAPEIQVGETYTLSVGASTQTITMTSLIYGSGSGMGGGFGGGMGGKGGMQPGGQGGGFPGGFPW